MPKAHLITHSNNLPTSGGKQLGMRRHTCQTHGNVDTSRYQHITTPQRSRLPGRLPNRLRVHATFQITQHIPLPWTLTPLHKPIVVRAPAPAPCGRHPSSSSPPSAPWRLATFCPCSPVQTSKLACQSPNAPYQSFRLTSER